MQRICLVTEELTGVQGSGGIGAAFYELALLLANHGYLVDVMYCPIEPLSDGESGKLQDRLTANGIKLRTLDSERYVHRPVTYEKKSYALYQQLKRDETEYDFIHFHDYKGLGFFAINAKKQGLAFLNTCMVVQLHGPTRWAIDANQTFFFHEDQLKIDFMERESIRQADHIVSPSAYLIGWLREHNFVLPPAQNTHIIKNVCTNLYRQLAAHIHDEDSSSAVKGINEIVLFARHEDRKGFATFCSAVDRIADILTERNVSVTFLGKLGLVNGQNSGIFLIEQSKRWKFSVNVYTTFDRDQAAEYLASRKGVAVVIASPYENSPYTVFESIVLRKPLITSSEGGAHELIGGEQRVRSLCHIDTKSLAERILNFIEHGAPVPALAEPLERVEQQWLTFHRSAQTALPQGDSRARSMSSRPKVVFGITHHERPQKLIDAISSAVRQTYDNIEIVVVDDGSESPETLAALEYVETLLKRVNGKLLRQKNAYLGAARNMILRNTDSEYICFLDDDDIALPTLVETLVTAIENTGADVVNCINIYLEEKNRLLGIAAPERYDQHVNYIPLGGPLSIAASENCLGAATALFRRSALEKIGGYTELHGVGHEDYELFLRLLQSGAQLMICPEPLYLYEVGRPSMLSKTSLSRNFHRCFEALETSTNSTEWRDLTNLHIGKKVAENSHNRTWWQYSIASNADLRLRIFQGHAPREEQLQMLAELAAREGNTSLSNAFIRDLANARQSASEQDENYFQLQSLSALNGQPHEASKRDFDSELADIKVDMALGRTGDAMSKLTILITNRALISADAATLLLQFPDGVLTPEEAEKARRLGSAFLSSRISCENRAAVFLGLLRLFSTIGDQQIVKRVIDSIIESDEQEYLALHVDVRNAVEQGRMPNGFMHFQKFGHKENRSGFSTTRMAADEISSILGKKVMAWEIKDVINAGFKVA